MTLTIAFVAGVLAAGASKPVIRTVPEGAVSDVKVERAESTLMVSMTVHPSVFSKKSNRETWLTPAIVAGSDTLRLDPVVVAGHTRYYQHERIERLPQGAVLLHAGASDLYSYTANVPYEQWMQLSQLVLTSRIGGCCGNSLRKLDNELLATMDYRDRTLYPALIYVSPTKEIVKVRNVSGQAYVDFPVNKTVIVPDYRRNPTELAAIRRTIDEIRNDADITIRSLTFTGYASPEGSYANNERLARGRTESLIEYVRKLYAFPRNVMHASWVAEDWAGLIKRLQKLDIENHDALLAIATDDSLTPDQRDARLKNRFPQQYAYLLAEVYPTLRHSDYVVEYQVRNYVDVKEIAAVMATEPQKLSIDELFLLAKSFDKDSPEFREVMEVAVRMYPDDPETNLNAATTAASFGDYDRALEYLKKAGDNPIATYTAGVIAAKQERYTDAAELLQRAADAGVAEAADLLATMREFGYVQ